MPNEFRISRQKLHEQVWSEPMRLLAPKYGLSDVGLAKICKKHNIPRPWLGYWTQVKHGVAIGPDKLPNPDDNPEIVLRAHQPPSTGDSGHADFTNIFDRALAAEADWPRIVVPRGRKLRDETSQPLAALRENVVDELGRSSPKSYETLDVQVAGKNLHRAHVLLDVLFEQLEWRGCEVRPVESIRNGTFVRYCGEYVGIRIVEQLKVEAVDSHKTVVRSGYYEEPPLPPWPAKQTAALSGRLTLQLDATCPLWDRRLRRTWRDTEHQRLEDCLNDVIVGIVRIAGAQRLEDASRVARKAETQDAEMKQKIRAAREGKIAARLQKLEAEVANRCKAESLRAYVAAARRQIADVSAAPEYATRWLDWAEKHADGLDPLSAGNVHALGMAIDDTERRFYVRPALPSEHEEIPQFVRRASRGNTGSGDRDAELIKNLLDCGACDPELSLVAVQDGRLVGCVVLSNIGVQGRPGLCGVEIGPVCVDPEFRGQRIGTELVDTGIYEAIEHGKAFICARYWLPSKLIDELEFAPAGGEGIKTPFDPGGVMFVQLAGAMEVGEGVCVEYPTPWIAPLSPRSSRASASK